MEENDWPSKDELPDSFTKTMHFQITSYSTGLLILISLWIIISGLTFRWDYIGLSNLFVLFEFPIKLSVGYLSIVALIVYNHRSKQTHKQINIAENQKTEEIDRETQRFYLETIKDMFQQVYNLLEDQNNDRVTWVRASRILYEALEIGKLIKLEDLCKVYVLEKSKLRSKLYSKLTVLNDTGDAKQSLPPQFFYGINDWDSKKDLNEAAIESAPETKSGILNINTIFESPNSKYLCPESIVIIFDFLEFPQDYDDPLRKVTIWDERWENNMKEIRQGALQYVEHKRRYKVINKKILKNEQH